MFISSPGWGFIGGRGWGGAVSITLALTSDRSTALHCQQGYFTDLQPPYREQPSVFLTLLLFSLKNSLQWNLQYLIGNPVLWLRGTDFLALYFKGAGGKPHCRIWSDGRGGDERLEKIKQEERSGAGEEILLKQAMSVLSLSLVPKLPIETRLKLWFFFFKLIQAVTFPGCRVSFSQNFQWFQLFISSIFRIGIMVGI